MTTREIAILRTVVLIRRKYSIIRAHLQHVFGALRRPAIDGEGVVWTVDGAPVCDGGFETSFDFPVFDEVLDEGGEGGCFVGLGFGWRVLGGR